MKTFEPYIECLKSIMPSRMKGKTILWWSTFNVLGMCWYSLIKGKPMDGSIAIIYGTIITAFVGSKSHELYEERMKRKMSAEEAVPQ